VDRRLNAYLYCTEHLKSEKLSPYLNLHSKFLHSLHSNKKSPHPKEGDDYGAMSFRRQRVVCLPTYIYYSVYDYVYSTTPTIKATKDRTLGAIVLAS